MPDSTYLKDRIRLLEQLAILPGAGDMLKEAIREMDPACFMEAAENQHVLAGAVMTINWFIDSLQYQRGHQDGAQSQRQAMWEKKYGGRGETILEYLKEAPNPEKEPDSTFWFMWERLSETARIELHREISELPKVTRAEE